MIIVELRKPRTEIPPSSYGRDMLKLFHPLMFAPILMLVTIGTFLSNEVSLQVYLIELVGVFFAVLCAYHLDEAKEKVTAPYVPQIHNAIIAVVAFIIAMSIGVWLFLTVSFILIIPTVIAFWGIFFYNMDIIKHRLIYALSWGGTPIFGSYMVQTGELPTLTVIIFTVFGMLLATKLFWNWSLRCCGRYALCNKNCGLITFPVPPGYVPNGENKYCHSPNTMKCLDRLQVPREVNSTMKILQKLDLLILFALTIGIVIT